MIDNKKLLKELAAIYTSSNKAKQAVLVEISKIDEKYKKLAEAEKSQLSETVKMLDSQLKYYGDLLNLNEGKQEKVEEAKEEPEEEITDSIFPENNEEELEDLPEDLPEDTVEEPAPAKEKSADGFGDIWPEESEEKTETKEEEKTAEDDEWPAFPEEWNN